MFATPADAKQFFVDRIIREAQSEGESLSPNEALMLRWSEVNRPPDWTPEFMTKLAEDFAEECDDATYETKIVGLLRRAYERDIAAEGEAAAERYRAALSAEDHYILVMIEQALGGKIAKRRKFLGIF